MADILLSIGVQTAATDVSAFRSGVEEIVKQINSDPPKVQVGVEVSKNSLGIFKKQLSQIVNGVTLSNGSKVSIKIDGVGEIKSQADSAAGAIKKVSDTAKDAASSTKKMGDEAAQAAKKQKKSAEDAAKKEKEKITLLKQANSLMAKMQNIESDYTKAANGMSHESYDHVRELRDELRKIAPEFEKGEMSAADFGNRLKEMSGEVELAKSNMKVMGENTKTLGSHLMSLGKKFVQWFGVSQLIMYAVSSAKKMVNTVIELDTAMTELRKVTNETEATYDRFLTNAAKRAKEVGATLTDVVTASADFSRLGYSLDEASKLADTAIVYKNVADGISDISEASSSIVSTMQAFQIDPSDAMSIVDKFNNVSNNFAISSAGIGESLQKSAAAMYAAGNTLDETIAMTAAANTVLQNPEVVGGCSPSGVVTHRKLVGICVKII